MRHLLPAAIALLAASTAAEAQDVVRTGHAETRLMAETSGLAPGAAATLILDQTLDPGWHVYWKNPGDSGLPLDLEWTLPEGFRAGDVVYPTPKRIRVGPLANYGFEGRPAFLIPVTVPASARVGEVVDIGLKASWLICEEICVPEEATFSLSLPIKRAPDADAEGAARAAEARAAAPRPLEKEGAFNVDGGVVILSLPVETGADGAYFFPVPDGLLEPAAEQAARRAGPALILETPAAHAAADLLAAGRVEGVVTIDGASAGYEAVLRRDAALKASTPATSPAPKSGSGAGAPPSSLLLLVGAALFGGLLLNVMPCVFPIVFIKAATLLKTGGAAQGVVRRDGLAYFAGVVTAFAVLGGVLLVLRAGGAGLGWGFHLQSPAVVLLSAYILFMVGLNLAGAFHVGSSLQNAGGGLASRGGAAGAYFTGLLAVVVAAPCVGPLLTAPIGAAALLPPAEGMLIFLAMGVGLAAPFLLLSFAPGLGRFLPKPGAWTETLRQALAFPVFAGAAYFLWVLTVQTGAAGLAPALAGAVLLAAGAWLFERSKSGRGRVGRLAAFALVAAGAAQAVVVGGVRADAPVAASHSFRHAALTAQPYAEATLSALRAEGRPVFVDFTAAWCVTCQFNKLTVFSDAAVAKTFEKNGIAVLVADWTRRDPAITRALEAFGANGVPLYAYYPPGGEARVAPQPLTVASLNALISRKGNTP